MPPPTLNSEEPLFSVPLDSTNRSVNPLVHCVTSRTRKTVVVPIHAQMINRIANTLQSLVVILVPCIKILIGPCRFHNDLKAFIVR